MSGVQVQKTTLTGAEQLELKNLLAKAETREEKVSIYNAYCQKVGLVREADNKGIAVEKTTVDDPHVKTTTDTTANINTIAADMGLIDEADINELKKAFADAGIAMDEEGNIAYNTNEEISNVTEAVQNYINANTKETLEFTKESDQEFIQQLVDDNIIKQTGDNGEYEILNQEELEKALSNTENETETQEPQTINIKTTSVTTTETEEGRVDIPEDLRHNKDAKKQLENEFKKLLTEWVQNPENEPIMLISLAKTKYAKEIDKQADKLMKEYTNKKSDVELLADYFNKYAGGEANDPTSEKGMLQNIIYGINTQAFPNEGDELSEEQQLHAASVRKELVNALNRGTGGKNYFTEESLSDPDNRRNAILYYIVQNEGFDKNYLIDRMATLDVIADKQADSKQFEKDKKEWINDEAKRQTQAAETAQNVQNTRIHFSKDARKTAEKNETNSAIEHNDIGEYGRELVKKCPTYFGNECSKSEADFQGEDGKYYKFNEGLFKEFCAYACHGDVESLSDEAKKRFGADGSLTLQEGRDALKQQIFKDKDGNPRSIEQLMGNSNGKVGNSELNKFRHLIEKSGEHVDTNSTNAKRALHVLKGAAQGAVFGFASGFVGSVLTSAVSFAGQCASQMVDYSAHYSVTTADRTVGYSGVTEGQTVYYQVTTDGKWVPYSGTTDPITAGYSGVTEGQWVKWEYTTEGQWVPYSGTTDGQWVPYSGTTPETVIPDSTTFNYTSNGETFSQTVNKNITVPGQEYSGTVWANGQPYSGEVYVPGDTFTGIVYVDGQPYSGTITIPGQEYSGQVYVPGETIEGTIYVNGQPYSGKITIPGETIEGDVQGQKEVEGQKYKGKQKQNHLKNGLNAALFGAATGAALNAFSMGKVHAKGKRFSGIVDLRETKVEKGDPETANTEVQVNKKKVVTVRSGEIGDKIGFKPCKLKVTRKDQNTNTGETMESMVAQYYKVQEGSDEHKQLMKKIKEFNNVDRFGGFAYTADNIFNLPDKIILGEKTYDRAADPSNPEEKLKLNTQDIPLGGNGLSHKASSTKIDTVKKAKGTITKS